jgi:phenylacetate-CoA ligase
MKNLEDLLYPFLNSYKRSPQSIKNVAGGIYSLLPENIIYGRKYLQFIDLIKRGLSFTKEDFEAYEWEQLSDVLDIAFTSIPFYQSLYAEYGIKRNQIQNFKDFTLLPLINKEMIKENLNSFTSSKFSNQKLKMNTGGSSGSPLEFFIHKGITRPKERAFLNAYFQSLGYNRAQKSITFRGDVVPGKDIYMYDPIRKNYIFSSYRITEKTLNKIILNLNKIKPDFLFGYPSVVYDLSNLIISESQLELNISLKGIILLSEKLFDFQIKKIEEAFKTKVNSYYGHSERLILGYKCSNCNNYLMDRLYGYAELVDKNDQIIDANKAGRIIGTGFHNFVMPLIRYDTNDISCFAHEKCDRCGSRKSKIFGDIEGRTSDYLIGSDYRKISITGIIFGQHLDEFKSISKFQLTQHVPGEVNFNIVAKKRLSPKDHQSLKRKIESASDNTILVSVNYVDELEKSPSGKFQYLRQYVR